MLSAGLKQWVCINTVLGLLVVASALAVVRSTHETREQLNVLEQKRRQSAALHVQSGQYLLEQSAWDALGRIETEATEKLNMVLPRGDQLVVVAP